jgi:uncharacterized oxidoreductase
MITIQAEALQQRVAAIFAAAGASAEDARQVAHSLVESNLVGHDSHGVIRVSWYMDSIRKGALNPQGQLRVVSEAPAAALVDCGWTFGQLAAAKGMEMAVARARRSGIGMIVLRHCWHAGRIGEFAVQAAEQGLMGMVFCNGSARGGLVAPFGGTRRALGANPIAWAIPGPQGRAIFLDMATSIVAQGKVAVAADKGELLPEGWLLDKEGRPSRNPQDQADGGALLPFGTYKGYALSVLIELVGGGLSGAGFCNAPDYEWDQGTVLLAVDMAFFWPPAERESMVTDFIARLKATPRESGCDEILLPGEPEWRTRAQREREGIPLPEATWERLRVISTELGLAWSPL